MFIKEQCSTFPIITMLKILNISKSGYFEWLHRKPSKRSEEEQVLVSVMKEIHRQGRYLVGSPKMLKELCKRNWKINHKRVERLMKKHGITALYRKKFKVVTTNSNHRFPISANLLKRKFKVEKPNRVWASDITYLKTNNGWLYLCVVIDLFSRKVVGWSMSQRMHSKLVIDAFNMACKIRKPEKWTLIFHSDRGSQYASYSFRRTLKTACVISSMSRRGNCWDNACAESWFGLMKREMLYLLDDDDFNKVKSSVFEYIEVFYNRQRSHSTLHYMTPEEYELKTA